MGSWPIESTRFSRQSIRSRIPAWAGTYDLKWEQRVRVDVLAKPVFDLQSRSADVSKREKHGGGHEIIIPANSLDNKYPGVEPHRDEEQGQAGPQEQVDHERMVALDNRYVAEVPHLQSLSRNDRAVG